MKRLLPTIGVASLLGLLAGCSPANDSPASGAPGPISSNPPPEPPSVPTAAPPLSERGAHALSLDHMQRLYYAMDGRDPGPPNQTVDDTFIVIAGDPSAPLDDAVKVTRETVDALWNGGVFMHRPEQSVVAWVTSSSRALHALARAHAPAMRDTGLGLYDVHSRQIFAASDPSGWGTYRHELIHPLLRADFPLAPAWLTEGLPALFEVSELRPDGTFGFGAHFRLETLRAALTRRPWSSYVRLDTLFTWTTDEAFRKNEQMDYAMAREALRWLHAQGLLWPFYTAWRDDVLDDPTGEKTFEKVVNKTPAEATQAWGAWLCSAASEDVVPAAGRPQ